MDRRCKRCGLVKSLHEFYLTKRSGVARNHTCRTCDAAANHAWVEANYSRMMVHQLRARCKKRGIPFDLDASDLAMPDRCPLLGIPIFRARGAGQFKPNSPSVDRLDPARGYVKGNVWVISNRANTIKHNASPKELRLLVNNLEAELSRRFRMQSHAYLTRAS